MVLWDRMRQVETQLALLSVGAKEFLVRQLHFVIFSGTERIKTPATTQRHNLSIPC